MNNWPHSKSTHLFRLSACVLAMVLFSAGCADTLNLPKDTPACVRHIAQSKAREPVASPPASIWEHRHDGQIFYYVPPQCCDQFSVLMDQDCNTVCAPDGGITGNGDGNCPNFTHSAEPRLIWQDPRK